MSEPTAPAPIADAVIGVQVAQSALVLIAEGSPIDAGNLIAGTDPQALQWTVMALLAACSNLADTTRPGRVGRRQRALRSAATQLADRQVLTRLNLTVLQGERASETGVTHV